MDEYEYEYYGLSTEEADSLFTSYGLNGSEVQSITIAKDKAAKSGQTTLFSILDYVFKYGAQAADILVKTGVIKNRNVYQISAGDINEAALSSLLSANGGTLPTSRSASVTATGTFNLSTFLRNNIVPISIIGGIGVITYVLTTRSTPEPRKRRRY